MFNLDGIFIHHGDGEVVNFSVISYNSISCHFDEDGRTLNLSYVIRCPSVDSLSRNLQSKLKDFTLWKAFYEIKKLEKNTRAIFNL